jgi:hypothetical protein
LPFEDEFSAVISEEEEGVVNFDCPVAPPSPNSYAVLDRSGLKSPMSSSNQLRRHVDTFTNRIDDMLSAAREGVSHFPSASMASLGGRGHQRLPDSEEGLDSADNNSQPNHSARVERDLEDDPSEEEITVELMSL